VTDHAALVDHEDDRQGDAVPRARLFELRVGDAEGRNDLRICIRQQRVADIAGVREAFQRRRFVMRDQRNVIAERAKFLDPGVPGDRLDLAVGSPVQGAGKQDHQTPAVGKGFEILVLVPVIDRFQVVGDFRAHRRSRFQRVVLGRPGEYRACQENGSEER
jgi:hypothetical protein